MPQHFIKIEIKGESDLPEKDDLYWVHGKISNTITLFSFHNNKEVWLSQIDWYFSPEPQQPEQPESAETWLKNRSDYDNIEGAVDIQWLINLLTEFSQSHNNTVVGPTEEEVMTYFNNHTSNVVNNGYVTLKAMVRSEFLDAIKWFRSQVREVELKTELVKFCEKTHGYQLTPYEKIVDDYLKSPENK